MRHDEPRWQTSDCRLGKEMVRNKSETRHGRRRSGNSDRGNGGNNNGCGHNGGGNGGRRLFLFLYEGNIARMSAGKKVAVMVIALVVGYLHSKHVGAMFENDRHFSHLSTVEREMTFRTEMGLYYSYFKALVEAPTLFEGVRSLYANNVTEYPHTINTLKRFNLYPEVLLGSFFRAADQMNLLTKQCWKINRGGNLSPVLSCDGLGDLSNFYVSAVWFFAGFTTTFLFLLGVELSDSILGGAFAVLCFFFNHGECTRVQWTPPLRESFAYPICMAHVLAVTLTLREGPTPGEKATLKLIFFQVVVIAGLSCLFILFWQFAQFALLTQTCCLFALFILGFIHEQTFKTVLSGLIWGLVSSVLLMFGNEMLFTSWLSSVLLSCWLLVHTRLDHWFLLTLPRVSKILARGVMMVAVALVVKVVVSQTLGVKDDAHIFEILRSKFSDFRNFHTLLYTCAVEFDFLGVEMPIKTSLTLLLPSALLVSTIVAWKIVKSFAKSLDKDDAAAAGQGEVEEEEDHDDHDDGEPVDPCIAYNLLQMICYAVMAIIIMRLKLFWGPQLCVLASLLASEKVLSFIIPKRQYQLAFLAVVVAVASVRGVANIKDQRSIIGEYSNAPLEELIEWINTNIPATESMAGPMAVMANLLLSTGRPVINHPHYEDADLRERTRRVYEMFSRHDPDQLHKTLKRLRANYLVLAATWCLRGVAGGCGMTDIWDVEEPHMKNKMELCPKLWNSPSPDPFRRVFANQEYVLLKV